jgi:Zn-dependent protease
MLRSWKIGRAFGIPVYVHPSFLLAPLLVLVLNNGGGGLVGALFLVSMVVAVFGCVILHEFGHALVARSFGIRTRNITIYPIGGVARLEGMSERPRDEILIALAGPAVNIVIVALLTPAVVLADVAGLLTPEIFRVSLAGGIVSVLALFAKFLLWSNVLLAVFNLIPAFPMDGGRVLRALLSIRLGFPRATEVATRVGTVLAFLMGAAGLFMTPPNYMLPVLALFVVLAGQQELLAVRRREALKLAHRQLAILRQAMPVLLPVCDTPAVGRAVEVLPPAPNRHGEPQLLFYFRAIEVPERPQ